MGQPSGNRSTGKLEPETVPLNDLVYRPRMVEIKVDSEPILPYNKEIKVRLVSLLDARLVYTGQVTGKQYEWIKAGSVIEVDAEDSEILLAKRIYGTCCGNSPDGTPLFQITT